MFALVSPISHHEKGSFLKTTKEIVANDGMWGHGWQCPPWHLQEPPAVTRKATVQTFTCHRSQRLMGFHVSVCLMVQVQLQVLAVTQPMVVVLLLILMDRTISDGAVSA